MTTKKRERNEDLSLLINEPIKKKAKVKADDSSDYEYIPDSNESSIDSQDFIIPLSPKEDDNHRIPSPKTYDSDDDEYTHVYCGMIGCQNTYFTGKNGSICNGCGINACEECSCNIGDYDDTDDEWYCDQCVPIHEEEKKKEDRLIDLMLESARLKALKKNRDK